MMEEQVSSSLAKQNALSQEIVEKSNQIELLSNSLAIAKATIVHLTEDNSKVHGLQQCVSFFPLCHSNIFYLMIICLFIFWCASSPPQRRG
jgi:hypothetical protein